MNISLPPLNTLEDVIQYPSLEIGRMSPTYLSSYRIKPIGNPGCDGRWSCIWCTQLCVTTAGNIETIIDAKNPSIPMFALCHQGEGPANQILLDILPNGSGMNKNSRKPQIVEFGSSRCPRTLKS